MQSPEKGISSKIWDWGRIDKPSGDENQMPCGASLTAITLWGPHLAF